MHLRLQRYDGTAEEIEVAAVHLAHEISTRFDWDAERRRFANRGETEECYLPSIAFTDDAFRLLEFGPNPDDETFWLLYRYPCLRSTFGFHPVEEEEELNLPHCTLHEALDLLAKFYRGQHSELTQALPAPPPISERDIESTE